jgi:hypothetical protein
VNGPQATLIVGGAQTRGVYVSSNAILSGFTIQGGQLTSFGGAVGQYGAGVFCAANEIITNCIITGNKADGLGYGGGIYGATVYASTLSNNSANSAGGGAARSILFDCVVTGNTASNSVGGGTYQCVLSNCVVTANYGRDSGGCHESTNYNCILRGNTNFYGNAGGAYSGKLYNCVLTGNTGGANNCQLYNCTIVSNTGTYAVISGNVYNSVIYYNANNNWSGTKFNNSITFPASSGIVTTNAPRFVNLVGGDFRLQSNSPCINAGNNTYATSVTDLDDYPRISGGTVDIGAYEFQSPASVLSYAWAQQNGLPTDGSADFADDDGDGANNWQEWRADTGPTNAASALLMGTATNGVTGLVVSWASVATRSYWLERATDLSTLPPFQPIATNLPGVAGTKTYNDTSATNGGPYFYRVGVQ